ncbi:MAG: hypothetical protein HFF06_05455 [Oscillospiraceae bacterium]|jgi:hypothetical protein|nr:hypothetical protein [Oscillospiraceae bacterium]
MKGIVIDTIQRNGHEWTITRRIGIKRASIYAVYRDGEFWSTADSYRDAMDEIEEAER